MSTTLIEPQDPQNQGPKPEYPQELIGPPGTEAEMTPQADHGEQTYVGTINCVTGSPWSRAATAGSAGQLPLRLPAKVPTW
jgi:hypothetical protein